MSGPAKGSLGLGSAAILASGARCIRRMGFRFWRFRPRLRYVRSFTRDLSTIYIYIVIDYCLPTVTPRMSDQTHRLCARSRSRWETAPTRTRHVFMCHEKATTESEKRECETSLHVPVYGVTASLPATYLYGVFEGCPRCLLLFSSLQASATRRGARGAPASVGHGRTGRGGRTARARAGCVGCAASERAAREVEVARVAGAADAVLHTVCVV